ncbi:MAG: GNAT family N-acetyltransferase [Hyphomicrobiaceae bacterium]
MPLTSFQTELRDGTPVQVRPVESGDQHLLEMGLEHLSEQSRYLRFFRPVHQLSDKELEKFTKVDQTNHIAVGAIDLTHSETYPVGIARCIRLENRPDEAEMAVAVIDSHQGKGLGTILLAAISLAATARDITTLVATVLRENHSMRDLLHELGATSDHGEAGVVSMRIPIYEDACKYPDTPTGTSFRRIYEMLA